MTGLLEDLLSGRSSDIFGAGLLTPEQRGGLGNIGLLAAAGKLGQLAGPSFSPVPDFGAALGQAAGAYGASQEGAGTAALNAILTGQKGRKLEQELAFGKQIPGTLAEIMRIMSGLGSGGTAATPGSGGTGGGAGALTPGGALPGNPGSLAMAESPEIQEAVAHKLATTSGIQHWASFNPQLASALQSAGLPTSGPLTEAQWQQANPLIKQYESGGGQNIPNYRFDAGHTAGGTHQITNSTWNSIGGPAIAASMRGNAAAPAGGGGLLSLPLVPNFSSRLGGTADAGDATAPADVLPNRVGRFAGVAPGTPVNSRGFPYNPEITDPAVAARVAQSMAAIKQAQQSGVPWAAPRETSGSSASAPEDIYAGTDTPQGPMGNPGPAGPTAMASGLLAPGGPLTRGGVPGMPAMPAAAAPSADLQLGPLAPAPAAAAPAAPGPGLLSPPGALPAAALPRGANPAYGNVSTLLGILGVQAEAAGLKNVFAPLADAFRQSPAFQAQLEREKARVGVEFAGPKTTAEKTAAEPFDIRASERALGNSLTEKGWRLGPDGQAVRIPGYDQMTEATALATARGTGEGGLQTTLIIKSVENQNKIIADAAANGNQVTFDKDGKMSVSRLPGADAAAGAQAGAVTGAQEEAKARVAAGTAPGIAGQTKYAETTATQDAAARAQAIAARNTLPLLDDAKEQLTGAGIFSGPAATLNMTLAQVATAAGWPSDKLVNTQTYIQQAGARAAEILRSGAYGTGSGISQNDLRAADKLANGDITLDIKTIKRIMDLAERKAARDIDNFNAIANKRDPSSAVEHPPRWTGRYTSDGKRIDKMPDGSLQVKE